MNGPESIGFNLLQTLFLDACGKTTLLLLFAWGVTSCFRRMGAAQKHFLWLCALLGVVYITGAALLAGVGNAVGLKSVRTTLPVRVWHSPDVKRVAVVPPFVSPANMPAPTSAAPSSTVVHRSIGFPGNAACIRALGLIWLLGSLLTLFRLILHFRAVRLLQQRSTPLANAEIDAILRQITAHLGVARSPVLLQQAENGVSPLTWGWRHTFLLLPTEAQTWPQERIEAVLLHETAHIRRGDWTTQRVADAVCALFWFHPLVWLAAQKMRDCAERACDDMALEYGIAPNRYAQHLLDIAHTLRSHAAAKAMTLPLLRPSQLETRLRAVLDDRVSRRAFSRLWQYGIMACGALSLLPFALALPVSTQNVRYVDANVVTAVKGKALLPGGVTVELLGIAETDADAKAPAHWWQSDGAAAVAPYDLTNAFRVKDTETGHRIQRIFGVRISNAFEQNPETVRELLLNTGNKSNPHETLGSYGEVYENHLQSKKDSRYTLTRTDYFGSPHLSEHGTFRYGVALGEWHDLATADPTLKNIGVTITGAHVLFKQAINKAYIMQLPGGKQTTGITIETQDDRGRVARRLVAVTKQGKIVKIENIFSGPDGAMTPYTCLIPPDLSLKDVREFRLQTRAYTWAEFPDVALHPRK